MTVNETNIASLDNRTTALGDQITQVDDRVTNIDARVTSNGDNINVLQQQMANTPIQYLDAQGLPSTTRTDRASLVSPTSGMVTLGNVAAGELSATSTEAVNGSQLAATNSRVAANEVAIAANTGAITAISDNLQGSTVVAVQYSNPEHPTVSNGGTISQDVTLIGANGAEPVRLHNVAAGTAAGDAVNVAQLRQSLNNTLAASADYTDRRFNQLDFELNDYRQDSAAGIAGALAVAGLPQATIPGKTLLAGGVGYRQGEAAFSLGASTTFSDGEGVVKFGASVDSRGYGSASAGVGIQF